MMLLLLQADPPEARGVQCPVQHGQGGEEEEHSSSVAEAGEGGVRRLTD